MKKKYMIERIHIVFIILIFFMPLFEDKMSEHLYNICLFIVVFLACIGFPLFLIVSFLRYPKQGQGFAPRRSGKKGLTGDCIFFTGAGIMAALAGDEDVPVYVIPVFIVVFGICMVILKRYLITEIDRENEEERKIAEVTISFYLAGLVSLICFILKDVAGVI